MYSELSAQIVFTILVDMSTCVAAAEQERTIEELDDA